MEKISKGRKDNNSQMLLGPDCSTMWVFSQEEQYTLTNEGIIILLLFHVSVITTSTVVTISLKRCVIFYLVQLPAEALENVMLVNLENRLALVEDGVHDHAQRVHVGGWVTADGQDVLRGQVFRVGEAERREIGLPLFTCVLRLKRTREHKNENLESSRQWSPACQDYTQGQKSFLYTPQRLRGWWRRCWSRSPWSSRLRSCWGWCSPDTSSRGPFSRHCGGRTNPRRSGEREREKKMYKCQGELEPDAQ